MKPVAAKGKSVVQTANQDQIQRILPVIITKELSDIIFGYPDALCSIEDPSWTNNRSKVVPRSSTDIRGHLQIDWLRLYMDAKPNLGVQPHCKSWRLTDVPELKVYLKSAFAIIPLQFGLKRDLLRLHPRPLVGYKGELVSFDSSANGPDCCANSDDQEPNFNDRRPKLPICQLDQFFRCFRHAPLLTQISFFGAFGLIAGALMFSGIGAVLGLVGRGSRCGRWLPSVRGPHG
jgi:hypothetical protein